MSFQGRILYANIIGANNKECSEAWLDDVKNHLFSSPQKDNTPWVLLTDNRQWETSSEDAWE